MTELILAGGDAQTVPTVLHVAQSLGYSHTMPTPGRIKLERGSMSMTVAFGGLAGKSFHISFTFDIGVDAHGNTWLRFDQDGALGAVKGGAIGYAKSKTAYTEFLDAVRRDAAARGILLGER